MPGGDAVRSPPGPNLRHFGLTLALAGACVLSASPGRAQEAPPPAHDMAGMAMPAKAPDDAAPPEAEEGAMVMTGSLGRYPMSREGSGTSWQPDASPDMGGMSMSRGWMVMTDALVNGVYDHQGGPRGGDEAFASGMAMVMADRPLADGSMIGLRAMFSLDPLMGPKGYPLLLATGETADGKTPLVDRQHPHDLFVELAASYSRPISNDDNLFVYAGLPGEPAFGPPAFMHRVSGMDSPEAPISHHWLDSTHVSFGVVTAGWVHGPFKLEGSAFNGREPDRNRWDIEAHALSSWAARASWNPGPDWSLQASVAHLKSPEQLEPGVDQDRISLSAIYTRRFGQGGLWSTTLAWGRKDLQPGPVLDAWLLESAVVFAQRWTLFGRAERVDENELLGPGGPPHTVDKLSLGAIRDVRIAAHWKLGLGGLVSLYAMPAALKPVYGAPVSAMGFVRLKLS